MEMIGSPEGDERTGQMRHPGRTPRSSSGSACSAHGTTESPILAAINLDPQLRNSILRFSLDGTEKEEDLPRVAQILVVAR